MLQNDSIYSAAFFSQIPHFPGYGTAKSSGRNSYPVTKPGRECHSVNPGKENFVRVGIAFLAKGLAIFCELTYNENQTMPMNAKEAEKMDSFRELYKSDMHRYGPKGAQGYCRKFSYYFRKVSLCRNKLLRLYYRFRFRRLCNKHGIEMYSRTSIGKGLYIGHPYNITVNVDAVLGDNVNLHKGVTIGQENRGVRKGCPTIGNQVWIGINATIVGKITIGDDVLIAPNSYVNCDVPSHSVVLGNPCRIIHRDHATQYYMNNLV